ncbi:MAG: hypothetical protein KF857_11415 [Fimbriimonadaceae bacterium]|nr:hypothetical protein [Fimbriimonadaceae bacterium]
MTKSLIGLVVRSFVSLYVPALVLAGIGIKIEDISTVLPHATLGTLIRLPAFAVANYYLKDPKKRAAVSVLAVVASHLLVSIGQALNSGKLLDALAQQGWLPYLGTTAVALIVAVPAATIYLVWERRANPKRSDYSESLAR